MGALRTVVGADVTHNVIGWELSGPYAFAKTAGPARLSFADKGLTFATNHRAGVCLKFATPIRGIDPLGLIRHPGLTLTPADREGFVAAVTGQSSGAWTALRAQLTGDAETYNGYSVDDEDQPQGFGDSLVDDRGLKEPLDEGYSPPEQWSAAQRFGNTEAEADRGESLDQRLRQEVPDVDPNAPVARTSAARSDQPRRTSGRGRRGARSDTDSELYAVDVGIDGAGASAEEAAVHVIEDEAVRP